MDSLLEWASYLLEWASHFPEWASHLLEWISCFFGLISSLFYFVMNCVLLVGKVFLAFILLCLAIFLFKGLKYCLTGLYNRIKGFYDRIPRGRIRLVDEERSISHATLSHKDVGNITYSLYQKNTMQTKKTGQGTYVYKPIHENPFERPVLHTKHQHQLPLVIKNIPTETYRPNSGSQLQVGNKSLIVNTLDDKSVPKYPITKKPSLPPHKVAQSHAVIISQTSSRCRNCNQVFTEINPFLRVSKYNKLYCVGCQRLFFEISKPDLVIQSLRQMMMAQEPNRAVVFTGDLNLSNQDFLYTKLCQNYAQNLIEHMKERQIKARKNQESNGENRSKQQKKKMNLKDEDNDMVKVEELVELMRRSESKCAITRLTGVWRPSSPTHPFRLTVDHIVPICKGGSFAVSNLQITYCCINQLKGRYHNSNIVKFVDGYKEANKITAS